MFRPANNLPCTDAKILFWIVYGFFSLVGGRDDFRRSAPRLIQNSPCLAGAQTFKRYQISHFRLRRAPIQKFSPPAAPESKILLACGAQTSHVRLRRAPIQNSLRVRRSILTHIRNFLCLRRRTTSISVRGTKCVFILAPSQTQSGINTTFSGINVYHF